MAKKPAAPQPTGRDRLARDKARAVADRYLPDPAAAKGTGPWAAWALETIEGLEAQLAKAERDLVEAKGSRAPPPPPPQKLSAKQFAFAQEFIIDLNGSAAAIRAGYPAKAAAQTAYENLRKPHIAAVIADLMKERNAARKWDADKLYDRLGSEGDADVLDLYDEYGAFRPVREWPLVWRQGLVVGLENKELWEDTEDGRKLVGTVVKVKFTDRLKVKDMMGRHVNVQAFKDRAEIEVKSPLAALYAEIAGIGISPVQVRPPPGLGVMNSIRPVEQDPEGDDA